MPGLSQAPHNIQNVLSKDIQKPKKIKITHPQPTHSQYININLNRLYMHVVICSIEGNDGHYMQYV